MATIKKIKQLISWREKTARTNILMGFQQSGTRRSRSGTERPSEPSSTFVASSKDANLFLGRAAT